MHSNCVITTFTRSKATMMGNQSVSVNEENWLDDFIDQVSANLLVDKMQLETGTASDEKEKIYSGIKAGDPTDLLSKMKSEAQQYFVTRIIIDYLNLIKENLPEKLAFDYDDNEVLIWAVVKDDDENIERALIRAEAKVSASYYEHGYCLNTMIMEASENYPIPNHYSIFKG